MKNENMNVKFPNMIDKFKKKNCNFYEIYKNINN